MVDLVVEFRSRGWSGSADTFGPWRVITCDTMGAGWTRGSQEHRGLLNIPENGSAQVVLYDPTRKLDPANAAGPWYGQIDVGSDLRLTFGGRVVFIGRITTLDHVLEPPTGALTEPPAAIATIDALGYQGKIALTNLIGLAPDRDGVFETDEVTYARVNRILDYCSVPAAERDIEAGGVMHWDYNVKWNSGNGNAWDNLVMTMRGELGSLELTTTGVVRTRNRNTVWGTNPAATLQLGCHSGAIPVYQAEFATVRDTVRNSVNTTWENINADEGGPALSDATSIAKYGLRAYSEELGLYPGDAGPEGPPYLSENHQAWKSYFLARMKSPMKNWRVETRPTTQAQIDSIETTYLYTGRARLTIDQHGPMIDETLRVLGVEWSVDPDGQVCRIVLGKP